MQIDTDNLIDRQIERLIDRDRWRQFNMQNRQIEQIDKLIDR